MSLSEKEKREMYFGESYTSKAAGQSPFISEWDNVAKWWRAPPLKSNSPG